MVMSFRMGSIVAVVAGDLKRWVALGRAVRTDSSSHDPYHRAGKICSLPKVGAATVTQPQLPL